MKQSSVRPSVRPSVCLSHRSTADSACGAFAVQPARDIGRDSRAAASGRPPAAAPQHGGAARRSAANASSVTLTADVG